MSLSARQPTYPAAPHPASSGASAREQGMGVPMGTFPCPCASLNCGGWGAARRGLVVTQQDCDFLLPSSGFGWGGPL